MTTVDITQQQFRLSMLLYDTRYRSLTIQVVAVLALHAGRRLAGQQHRPEPRRARQGLQLRLPRRPRRLRHQPDADPLHQRQHPRPRGAGRHRQHAARRGRRLPARHGDRRPDGRAAPVQQLDRGPAGGGLCRRLPQHPGAAVDPRDHGDHHRHGAGAGGLPRRQRHRLDAVRIGRGHQPRRLPALAGVRPRLAGRGRGLHPLADRDHDLRALRRAPPGGDRRDPPHLLDQARPVPRAGPAGEPA